MLSFKSLGVLCFVSCVSFAGILNEQDPFVDRLIHPEKPVDILAEEDMQKTLLHIPLHQNENGEPVHHLAHKAVTVCKGAILPACTDLKTRVCDEGKNSLGSNRCSRNEHCISGRSCSPFGWCSGTSNVVTVNCGSTKICAGSWLPACTDRVTRVCDEGKNTNGSNRCSSDADCIQGRSCSFFGWCSGTQTVTVLTCPSNTVCQGTYMPPCTSRLTRACNEGTNSIGANKCRANEDCILGRTCSAFGYCSGTQTIKVVACARRLNEVYDSAHPLESGSHLAQSDLTYCKGAQLPTCTDRSSRICSEESNSWGSGRCNGHEDCMSGRNCNADGYCEGSSDAVEIDCTQ